MSGTVWEPVSDSPTERLERTPLLGGWLYRNWIVTGGTAHTGLTWTVSLVYIPPPYPEPLLRRAEHAEEEEEEGKAKIVDHPPKHRSSHAKS